MTWNVTAWKTRGGGTISFARGWDSQAVDITLSAAGRDACSVRLTPQMISELLLDDPNRIESYGPGYTMPHAMQDFLDGKWPLTDEQVAACLEQKVDQTPDFFPAPAPMRVDDEALSLARFHYILWPEGKISPDAIGPSQAFGGANLLGGSTDTSLVQDATPERHYKLWSASPKEGTVRFWLLRRFRRLRQRWLLGRAVRKINAKLRAARNIKVKL